MEPPPNTPPPARLPADPASDHRHAAVEVQRLPDDPAGLAYGRCHGSITLDLRPHFIEASRAKILALDEEGNLATSTEAKVRGVITVEFQQHEPFVADLSEWTLATCSMAWNLVTMDVVVVADAGLALETRRIDALVQATKCLK